MTPDGKSSETGAGDSPGVRLPDLLPSGEPQSGTTLLSAYRAVLEGRGALIIRNPVKRGQKCIEFMEMKG